MRKQQIKKLSLQKTRISDLKRRNVKGGLDLSANCPPPGSVGCPPTFERTICVTFCTPDQDCRFPGPGL